MKLQLKCNVVARAHATFTFRLNLKWPIIRGLALGPPLYISRMLEDSRIGIGEYFCNSHYIRIPLFIKNAAYSIITVYLVPP